LTHSGAAKDRIKTYAGGGPNVGRLAKKEVSMKTVLAIKGGRRSGSVERKNTVRHRTKLLQSMNIVAKGRKPKTNKPETSGKGKRNDATSYRNVQPTWTSERCQAEARGSFSTQSGVRDGVGKHTRKKNQSHKERAVCV